MSKSRLHFQSTEKSTATLTTVSLTEAKICSDQISTFGLTPSAFGCNHFKPLDQLSTKIKNSESAVCWPEIHPGSLHPCFHLQIICNVPRYSLVSPDLLQQQPHSSTPYGASSELTSLGLQQLLCQSDSLTVLPTSAKPPGKLPFTSACAQTSALQGLARRWQQPQDED